MPNKMFFKEERSFRSIYVAVAVMLIGLVLFFLRKEEFAVIENYKEKVKNMINIGEDKKDLGNMPNWNLSDLYSSINDKQIELDFQILEKEIKDFQSYRGKIKNLTGKELYKAVISYEDIAEIMAKIGSYSYLKYAENLSLDENVKFYQKVNERLTDLSSSLIFFALEINKIPNTQLNAMYVDSKSLRVYKPVIDEVRLFKPHQLNEKLEKLMMEKSLTGRDAWSRLFDETMDNMVFEYKGKKLNESEMLELMNSKDEKVRKETSKIFGDKLGQNGKLFAYITNTLAKDKEINDRWRKYDSPISAMNLNNQIDDKVVEALRETVKKNYANTAHRYYAWKAKQLGKEKLHYYDRNAQLPYNYDKFYKYKE